MVVCREDMDIIRTPEVRQMLEEYRRRFGEQFIGFNYADFPGDKETYSGQVYVDTLAQALRDNKPYHIVSHRYDDFDH